MRKNMNRNYKEVKLDINGRGIDRFYRNPLTKVFQYEYAMYALVSELFAHTECRSMCVDRLRLYFQELPDEGKDENSITWESVLTETENLVRRDVAGKVSFPMMHLCNAEIRIAQRDNGTHSFIFTDGIYGFALYLDMPFKGHPRKIVITNLNPGDTDGYRADLQSCDGHATDIKRLKYVEQRKAA